MRVLFLSEWLYVRQLGTQNLNPKCPAVKKLQHKLPGTWNINPKCPAAQKSAWNL